MAIRNIRSPFPIDVNGISISTGLSGADLTIRQTVLVLLISMLEILSPVVRISPVLANAVADAVLFL